MQDLDAYSVSLRVRDGVGTFKCCALPVVSSIYFQSNDTGVDNRAIEFGTWECIRCSDSLKHVLADPRAPVTPQRRRRVRSVRIGFCLQSPGSKIWAHRSHTVTPQL